jgi:hypothetical protein
MNREKMWVPAALVLAAIALLILSALVVEAAPPANDFQSGATAIGSLPFAEEVDLSEATLEPDEIQSHCGLVDKSVWYSYSPAADGMVIAQVLSQSSSGARVNVWSDGYLVDCREQGNALSFSAAAGATYLIQVGLDCAYPPCGGTVSFSLEEAVAPANDDFENAVEIAALPFSDSANIRFATFESGELTNCPLQGSIWYRFTPPDAGFYEVDANGSDFSDTSVSLWQAAGPGLGDLSPLDCTYFGGTILTRLEGGVTYYVQAGSAYWGNGNLAVNVAEITPPSPEVNYYYQPDMPSIYDTVSFNASGWDPANLGIATYEWEFGDGSGATGQNVQHQYVADGDYLVQVTATTSDGRSATYSRLVPVATHDVAITKFSVPNSASAGQTRTVVVGISNWRQPETVVVELYKSVPGGWQYVGTGQQSVPVRGGNRTTNFEFNYTFTADDAAVGKVTFRAVASVIGGQDAIPADNEAISMPVKVGR